MRARMMRAAAQQREMRSARARAKIALCRRALFIDQLYGVMILPAATRIIAAYYAAPYYAITRYCHARPLYMPFSRYASDDMLQHALLRHADCRLCRQRHGIEYS